MKTLYALLLFVLVLECWVRCGHAISNQLAAFHKAFEDARQELLGMSNLGADDEALLRQRRRTIDELLANFQKDLALADELDNDVGKGDWLSNGDLSGLGANKGCKNKGCGGDWKMARDLSALHKRLNSNDDLNEMVKLNLKYKGLSTKLKSPLLDTMSTTDSDSSSSSSSSTSDSSDDEDAKENSKKFQSILDKIEENNNRIGTIIQNANLEQTDTASLLNNIKNANADSKSTLSGISSYKGTPSLNMNSLGTLKKDKNKFKMPDLDLDLDEKPLQHCIDQLQVSNLANDQREQTKNDLSHEADYKLSKIEQDAAEPKKETKWKSSDMVRRNAYFNPMNEIKLKTSFRLMDRGFGPSLPSNALMETRRSMKVEDMLKRIEQNYDLDTSDASAKEDFDKLDSVLSVDENSFELLKSRYKRLEDDLKQSQSDINGAQSYDELMSAKKAFDNLEDVKLSNPELVGVIENRKQDEIMDNGNNNEKSFSPLNGDQGLAADQGLDTIRRVKRIGPLMDGFRAESLAAADDLTEASVENSAANMQRSRRSMGIVEQSKKRKKRSLDDGSTNKQKPLLLSNHTDSVQNHSLQKRSLQMSPRIVDTKKAIRAQAISHSHNQAQPRNTVASASAFHNSNDRDKRIYDEYNNQQQQSSSMGFDFGNAARTLGFERFDNIKPKSTFVNTDGMHFDNLYNDNINANSTTNANNNNNMAISNNNKNNNNYMTDYTSTKEKFVPFSNSNSNNENLNNVENAKAGSESNSGSSNKNNNNNDNQKNDAKLVDASSKETKSITCSMPSSSESSSTNNNNDFNNANSPFGNFSENTNNNDNNNQNYNGSSFISESTDDSKTLMLALRDEILNCTAFNKLESYLKSHTKNGSDGSNANSNSNSNANRTGGGAAEGRMDVVVDTSNKPSKAGKYDTSSSPHISTEPPEIRHRDELMKLNININASVIGDQKSTNFIGNGTINVRPSYSEERERRGVIFPDYESSNKRKCKTKNEFEYDASSSAHVDNVMDGKMSGQVVRTLFNFVRDHPTLKVLWPSLKNNHLPNYQRTGQSELSVMGDTEKAKSTQLLMQRAMSTINDIIEQQIRSRTCIPLRPDLNDFYELILNSCAEQENNRDKRESTLSLANAFSEELRAIDPNKIEAKSRIVKKLLKQYEELPHEDQQQVAGIRDDLLRDLMYLRKLRDGQNEMRERRKRELTEQRQQEFDADGKAVNAAVQRLESEYTPQFLKLLKTAEIFRDAAMTN